MDLISCRFIFVYPSPFWNRGFTRHPTMLEPDLISRIRPIFLQPRPHVSIMQATGLLGWSRRQMSEAIEAEEVELWTTPFGNGFCGRR